MTFYSVNATGLVPFCRKHLPNDQQLPVVIVPATMHYSWPKSAYILGLGAGTKTVEDPEKEQEQVLQNKLISIPVDAKARMKMDALEKVLQTCQTRRIPVLMAVGVLGSTQEGAVDPLDQMLLIREVRRKQNLDFYMHVDAALGGYLISTIRKDFPLKWPTNPEGREDFMKIQHPQTDPFLADNQLSAIFAMPHTIHQLKMVRFADSVTIDPHKSGYIQYPAGSILYRNGRVKMVLKISAPYIESSSSYRAGFQGPDVDDYSIGIYGVEGTRAGAVAAGVFLSHSVIRPSVVGYGMLLNRSLLNAKMFYCYLLYMMEHGQREDGSFYKDDFFVVPLQEPPRKFMVSWSGSSTKKYSGVHETF